MDVGTERTENRGMKKFPLLLMILILTPLSLSAQTSSRYSSGFDFTQRAADREKTRWSLSEWLAMKERNRQMDMWLSMNSPSPFEFMLGASYQSSKTEESVSHPNSVDFKSYGLEAVAYAQLVGLGAEYDYNFESKTGDFLGMFNLRLFGDSIQNSFLTLSYGLRSREFLFPTQEKIEQQFAQAHLQLYLTKYFGFDGKYRYFLPSSNDSLGDISSNYVEAGAFIDFKMIRIFGVLYKENLKSQLENSPEIENSWSGTKAGFKIFY